MSEISAAIQIFGWTCFFLILFGVYRWGRSRGLQQHLDREKRIAINEEISFSRIAAREMAEQRRLQAEADDLNRREQELADREAALEERQYQWGMER